MAITQYNNLTWVAVWVHCRWSFNEVLSIFRPKERRAYKRRLKSRRKRRELELLEIIEFSEDEQADEPQADDPQAEENFEEIPQAEENFEEIPQDDVPQADDEENVMVQQLLLEYEDTPIEDISCTKFEDKLLTLNLKDFLRVWIRTFGPQRVASDILLKYLKKHWDSPAKSDAFGLFNPTSFSGCNRCKIIGDTQTCKLIYIIKEMCRNKNIVFNL